MYEGKSIKPQCSCTCVSVGSTRVAQVEHAWFHCHYFCAGMMLLGQLHRRRLSVNHVCSAFYVHQRRATLSDPVFMVRRSIRGRNKSKNFGTIRNSVLPQRSVYEWIDKLKNGRTNVTHDKGAGRPSTATTEGNIERARNVILLDRRMTINEVAHVLQISYGSAYEIMHNKLEFHKVCARWVPKLLTEVHKQSAWTSAKNIWIAIVTNETSS